MEPFQQGEHVSKALATGTPAGPGAWSPRERLVGNYFRSKWCQAMWAFSITSRLFTAFFGVSYGYHIPVFQWRGSAKVKSLVWDHAAAGWRQSRVSDPGGFSSVWCWTPAHTSVSFLNWDEEQFLTIML